MVANDFGSFFDCTSRDRSRVLQRRRGGEELHPPRRRRPAAALPQAAVDEPGPDHALRRQAGGLARGDWPLGHRRAALRPRPRLLDLRTERQQRRLVERPAHQSGLTSARPSPSKSHGTTAAGWPVTLNIAWNGTRAATSASVDDRAASLVRPDPRRARRGARRDHHVDVVEDRLNTFGHFAFRCPDRGHPPVGDQARRSGRRRGSALPAAPGAAASARRRRRRGSSAAAACPYTATVG